jgi:hypothetical protein
MTVVADLTVCNLKLIMHSTMAVFVSKSVDIDIMMQKQMFHNLIGFGADSDCI